MHTEIVPAWLWLALAAIVIGLGASLLAGRSRRLQRHRRRNERVVEGEAEQQSWDMVLGKPAVCQFGDRLPESGERAD